MVWRIVGDTWLKSGEVLWGCGSVSLWAADGEEQRSWQVRSRCVHLQVRCGVLLHRREIFFSLWALTKNSLSANRFVLIFWMATPNEAVWHIITGYLWSHLWENRPAFGVGAGTLTTCGFQQRDKRVQSACSWSAVCRARWVIVGNLWSGDKESSEGICR